MGLTPIAPDAPKDELSQALAIVDIAAMIEPPLPKNDAQDLHLKAAHLAEPKVKIPKEEKTYGRPPRSTLKRNHSAFSRSRGKRN